MRSGEFLQERAPSIGKLMEEGTTCVRKKNSLSGCYLKLVQKERGMNG